MKRHLSRLGWGVGGGGESAGSSLRPLVVFDIRRLERDSKKIRLSFSRDRCCGSFLYLIPFLFSFVLSSLSDITIHKNKGK